ncbi:aldehyde dehydrogenase family protein [Nocardia yunnanensis]|uniref:Aldehyde dehydrogenase family protein n=1 Tax=Nocardia yunnanensis TaxID=2382165 RepID=A0A386Z977_9NOCA|nr:aldehyde dehydrogenase family protein [Nocardia yunnanensis]AYF73713.1 aldehyde dehydrogenase family protein [Nocardia yunnanensis]
MIGTVDPTTGRTLDTYRFTSDRELELRLRRADAAVNLNAERPISQRVREFRVLAELLRSRREDLALLITVEMGKPITQAWAEIDKCVATCEFYADTMAELLAPQRVDVAPDTAEVRLRPLGVLLAIMPWNYPFWQVFRAMLPAIAVGNAVVLKHADNVTGCAKVLQSLFDETFGYGILTHVVLPPHRVAPLIEHPVIAGVAFTGSNRVGALVAAAAGRSVKKSVLELGGSDAFIVLDDADVAAAATAAVHSRFLNTGQSCIAAKRIIVQRGVFAEFVEAMVTELGKLVYGAPTESGTDVGPMARVDLRNELRRQLEASVTAGARILFGGKPDPRPGAWFPPTLVQVRDTDSAAFREETFGPLGAVLQVGSAEAALAAAEDSVYGLSCSVWGRDRDAVDRLARRLHTGSVFVNRISESDPRLPVGGVKASGYGRELSHYGVTEFANVQTVRSAATPRSHP